MNDIVIKWRTAFGWDNHTIGGANEVIMALKMEEMVEYIFSPQIDLPHQLTHHDDTIKNTVDTLVLPVIFRIMKTGTHIGDVSHFYNELITYFSRHQSMISEFQSTIDVEAELCVSFSEDYVYKNTDPVKPKKCLKSWMKLKNGF